MYVEFDWDEEKAASNLLKHGISFHDAEFAFADPNAIFEQDREVDGEDRWQVIGLTPAPVLVTVAHTTREDLDRIHPHHLSAPRNPTGETSL